MNKVLSNHKLGEWEGAKKTELTSVKDAARKTKRLSPRFDGTDNKCGSETSSTECEARKQDVAYMIPVHPAGRFAIICHIQNIQWNTYTHIHIHIYIYTYYIYIYIYTYL